MAFPTERPRRLRVSAGLRSLVRENHLQPQDLIYPLFVREGRQVKEEIPSLPGIYRYSVDQLIPALRPVVAEGVRAVILFGISEQKDPLATAAHDAQGVVPRAVAALKDAFPQLVVMTDVCLCGYTDHGHCGIVAEGRVLNDPSLAVLGQMALAHARAGADLVAPSDMMDGRVGFIRRALDEAGFTETGITSYAAKYASSFYGPFRDAALSAPSFGDRRTYQMDPGNVREALRECRLDLQEGADIIMIKPALAYLDVVRQAKDSLDVPIAAYSVSGEYAMVQAAAQRGWLDEQAAAMEMLLSMKRAGADLILTYFAPKVVRWLGGLD